MKQAKVNQNETDLKELLYSLLALNEKHVTEDNQIGVGAGKVANWQITAERLLRTMSPHEGAKIDALAP